MSTVPQELGKETGKNVKPVKWQPSMLRCFSCVFSAHDEETVAYVQNVAIFIAVLALCWKFHMTTLATILSLLLLVDLVFVVRLINRYADKLREIREGLKDGTHECKYLAQDDEENPDV